MEALACGLLSVDACAVLVRELDGLEPRIAMKVWRKVQARLIHADESHAVLSPARLRALVERWVVEADPDGAAERRASAQVDADVGFRRRTDGLVDVYLSGLTAPNAHAILARVQARAQACGDDERPIGVRRSQAAVDLLLGRDHAPVTLFDSEPTRSGDWADSWAGAAGDRSAHEDSHRPGGSSTDCGCRTGQPVPCGMDVRVLVPLASALGSSTEPAHLEGHGPLDPELLQALLHNAPQLSPVWIDDDGTPVAEDLRPLTPGRGDPQATRSALLSLGAMPAPAWYPRHPDDHPPLDDHPSRDGAPPEDDRPDVVSSSSHADPIAVDVTPHLDHLPGAGQPPGDEPPPGHDQAPDKDRPAAPRRTRPDDRWDGVYSGGADASSIAAGIAGHPRAATQASMPPEPLHTEASVPPGPGSAATSHPPAEPGAYRIPAGARRLVQLRAPCCEWPACGAQSQLCDLDHDQAWPHGPTCTCNLGPLCRHHHRLKQSWMVGKQREPGNQVRWTDRMGRSWLSPSQHTPPPVPTLPVPPSLVPGWSLSSGPLAGLPDGVGQACRRALLWLAIGWRPGSATARETSCADSSGPMRGTRGEGLELERDLWLLRGAVGLLSDPTCSLSPTEIELELLHEPDGPPVEPPDHDGPRRRPGLSHDEDAVPPDVDDPGDPDVMLERLRDRWLTLQDPHAWGLVPDATPPD